MESVKSPNDIKKLGKNQIIGNPQIINSSINFYGENNILYCEGNVKLSGAQIHFKGDYSLIYLSSSMNNQYPLNLYVYNRCNVFFGRDNYLSYPIHINVQESQNVIVGSDCSIGSGVNIRTSDAHPIYNTKTKQRVNFPKSVYIGDHVWIGHLAYISKGAHIGSGSIIDNNAFVPSNAKVPSNTLNLGNPIQIAQRDVFFTKEFISKYTAEDTLNSKDYKSNVYEFEFVNRETLDINRIDKIINDLEIDDRLDFMQKLFVRNKRKNRFFIK